MQCTKSQFLGVKAHILRGETAQVLTFFTNANSCMQC